jgi:hypothetical protein
MDGTELVRLISGNSDPMAAYFKGRIQLAGDIMVAAQLAQMFKMPGPQRSRRGNGTGSSGNDAPRTAAEDPPRTTSDDPPRTTSDDPPRTGT